MLQPSDALFYGTRPVNYYQRQYFSSGSDVSAIKELLLAVPGVTNIVEYDGANGPFPHDESWMPLFDHDGAPIGSVTPWCLYGKDGRKVNCLYFDYNDPTGQIPACKLQLCVGILLYNHEMGESFNMGSLEPYTKLLVAQIKNSVEDDVQVVWGH